MKRIVFFLLISGLITGYCYSQDQTEKKSLAGSWLGRLEVSSIALRVVFNLSLNEQDSIVATLDSPDQGAKGIKIGPVSLDGSEISIKAPLLMAEYTGTIKNDTLIEGKFNQAGQSLPLNLVKQKRAFTLNRPQEPRPPFTYISEEVNFINEKAGIKMAGTLTIPEGVGPFPAVILITGSGPQNRNEELMGHKPFWVIADHLSRNGIAVLRYDDRGVGESQGSPLDVTSADFAEDAGAAFNFLRTRKEIDTELIGLAGHSEGGFIAPIVASNNSAVAYIVSLAGTGVPGEMILHRQNQDINIASGVDAREVRKGIAINKKIFSALKKEPDNAKAEKRIAEVYRKVLIKENKSPEEIDQALKQLNGSMSPVSYNWLRYFISTDPALFWKKVKCPVLALNGEKDLQVAADMNLPAIEKALNSGGNPKVTTVKIPDLNHLFQHCKTGLPSEYGEIEETFSPEVLKIMTDWINGL